MKLLINSIFGSILALSTYSCASSIKYSSLPEQTGCRVPFKVVEVGNPNYSELSVECLSESTLNGRDRYTVLEFNNELYRLIVDPEFPTSSFDKKAAEDLSSKLDEIKQENKKILEINCFDIRRISNINQDSDGIYFEKIN